MANLIALRSELLTDPLARGYAGMTPTQVVTSLNTANRTRARTLIASYEVVNAIVPADWSASQAERDRISFIVGAGTVDASNANVRSAFLSVFAVGSQTRTNLAALQNETVSRATELALGEVHNGDVTAARS